MKDRSFVLPDVLMASSQPKQFFSPQFFSPNLIIFGDDGSAGVCRFYIDVLGRVKLEVAFSPKGLVKACSDGSFIYKCEYKTVDDVGFPSGQGRWRRLGNTFELALYHHTNDTAFENIKDGCELWSSAAKIQGTKSLRNIGYVYFTCIERIQHELHLQEIAMSSSGVAHFLPTNSPNSSQFTRAITVPQQNVVNLRKRLRFWVDTEMISPSHVWLHRPMKQSAYYEVVLPKVFRVGVQPNNTIPFTRRRLSVPDKSRKILPYVIVGDADSDVGLIAPYHEEETLQIAKVDMIPDGLEIIQQWYKHQNTLLFNNIHVELAKLIEERV
jgi:hypothetical protein